MPMFVPQKLRLKALKALRSFRSPVTVLQVHCDTFQPFAAHAQISFFAFQQVKGGLTAAKRGFGQC